MCKILPIAFISCWLFMTTRQSDKKIEPLQSWTEKSIPSAVSFSTFRSNNQGVTIVLVAWLCIAIRNYKTSLNVPAEKVLLLEH